MNIRIPETLKVMLERASASSGRSVTAEIVNRLESSFPENVAHVLLSRRREEIGIIESQIEHKQKELDLVREVAEPNEVKRMQAEIDLLDVVRKSVDTDLRRFETYIGKHHVRQETRGW
jgi:hypothetical protein